MTGAAINGSAGAYGSTTDANNLTELDGLPEFLDVEAKTQSNPGDFFWYKLVDMENTVGNVNNHTYNVATISGVHNIGDTLHLPATQLIAAYDTTHLNYDFATAPQGTTKADFYATLPYFWVVEVPEIRLQDRVGGHHQNYTCFIRR
eukprot:COSAG05_NODE_3171_length_2268_cov_2.619640_1_plen_147_part_00